MPRPLNRFVYLAAAARGLAHEDEPPKPAAAAKPRAAKPAPTAIAKRMAEAHAQTENGKQARAQHESDERRRLAAAASWKRTFTRLGW